MVQRYLRILRFHPLLFLTFRFKASLTFMYALWNRQLISSNEGVCHDACGGGGHEIVVTER